MDTSTPKTMCQNMSPIAPAMKTTTPATEVPNHRIAPVSDDARDRSLITSQVSQKATAKNPE